MIDFYHETAFLKKNNIPKRTKPTNFYTKSGSIHPNSNQFMHANIYTQFKLFLYVLRRPIINGKMEEKTCGEGPSLISMFDDDTHLQQIIKNIKKSLNEGFREAEKYAATFQMYQAFYLENEAVDLQKLRETEHGNLNFSSFRQLFKSIIPPL